MIQNIGRADAAIETSSTVSLESVSVTAVQAPEDRAVITITAQTGRPIVTLRDWDARTPSVHEFATYSTLHGSFFADFVDFGLFNGNDVLVTSTASSATLFPLSDASLEEDVYGISLISARSPWLLSAQQVRHPSPPAPGGLLPAILRSAAQHSTQHSTQRGSQRRGLRAGQRAAAPHGEHARAAPLPQRSPARRPGSRGRVACLRPYAWLPVRAPRDGAGRRWLGRSAACRAPLLLRHLPAAPARFRAAAQTPSLRRVQVASPAPNTVATSPVPGGGGASSASLLPWLLPVILLALVLVLCFSGVLYKQRHRVRARLWKVPGHFQSQVPVTPRPLHQYPPSVFPPSSTVSEYHSASADVSAKAAHTHYLSAAATTLQSVEESLGANEPSHDSTSSDSASAPMCMACMHACVTCGCEADQPNPVRPLPTKLWG